MLALPADPGLRRQRHFQHGSAVGEHAIAELADRRRNAVGEPLQLAAQHLVVVAAERVARDERLRRIVQHLLARACRRRPVVHPRGDDAQRARNERSRAAPGWRRAVPYNPWRHAGPRRASRSAAAPRLSRSVSAMPISWKPSALPQRLMSAASAGQSGSAADASGRVRGVCIRESVHHARRAGARIMSIADLYLPDAAATEAAGARLARGLAGGMIVTLSGDLGAGKTTLVRGCLRALGWAGPVKSPSYPLVEHYPLSSLYFYHFDFYRFADPSEWETAGLADCFQPRRGLPDRMARAGRRSAAAARPRVDAHVSGRPVAVRDATLRSLRTRRAVNDV